jgi:solute carrier family 45, member 1/2/4
MIIGSLLCVFALLLFGYTRPVASVFVRFGTSAVCYHMFYSVLSLYFIDWGVWIQNNVLTIWLAVLSIYCIDFSINAGWSPLLLLLSLPYLTEPQVMAVDRALMVDVLPSPEQPSATAWAARMVFIGAIAGFYMYLSPPPYPSNRHFTDRFSSIRCGTYTVAP